MVGALVEGTDGGHWSLNQAFELAPLAGLPFPDRGKGPHYDEYDEQDQPG